VGRLWGRDHELEALTHAIGPPPWAVAICGSPGIGKTALLLQLLDGLPDGVRMLRAGCSEAERDFGFAGLTDLLSTVAADEIDVLPEPQRVALAAATLRTASPSQAVDPRAVGTGLATLLDTLARTGPVVVAVDDLQWMDQDTVQVLGFALRRTPVGFACSIRGDVSDSPVAAGLGDRLHAVTLGPLPEDALQHLVLAELGDEIGYPGVARACLTSGGNPFYALELARAIQASPHDLGPGLPLPLPGSLAALTTERIKRLGAEARRTVLHASLAARPTLDTLTGIDVDAGFAEAETAGIVVARRDGWVVFTHPLLADAAVAVAAPDDVRAAHRTLSAVATEQEARARHLAMASVAASAEAASALDAAVASARDRGATAEAAELARLALEHTSDPTSADGVRRALTSARLAYENGDATRSEELLRHVIAHATDPAVRAEAGLELTEVLWEVGNTERCVGVARAALADAEGVPALVVRAHLLLAFLTKDDPTHTAAATEIAASHELDPQLSAWVRLQPVGDAMDAGLGLDLVALDEALALERRGRPNWHSDDHVAVNRAVLLVFADEIRQGRVALEELAQRAEDEGNTGGLPYLLGHLSRAAYHDGDLAACEQAAHRQADLARATGQSNQLWQSDVNLGTLALARGDLDLAETLARSLTRVDESSARRTGYGLLGATQLRRGEAAAAVDTFDEWWRRFAGTGDPGISRHHGDRAEALVAAGELDRAEEFVDEIATIAERARRPGLTAVAERSRALLASARGQHDAAARHAESAVAWHEGTQLPLERGRTLLVKGRLHRRAKEKKLAQEVLTEALAIFEAAGADGWADEVRGELARVNLRPRASSDLTPSEARIAELAASGLTNREVAAAAFVSTKTVEANLARAYRKLGVRSRAELGRVMAERASDEGGAGP